MTPKIQAEIDRIKLIKDKDSLDIMRLRTLEQCKKWIEDEENYNNWIQGVFDNL